MFELWPGFLMPLSLVGFGVIMLLSFVVFGIIIPPGSSLVPSAPEDPEDE
jgi:hypothetical protein